MRLFKCPCPAWPMPIDRLRGKVIERLLVMRVPKPRARVHKKGRRRWCQFHRCGNRVLLRLP